MLFTYLLLIAALAASAPPPVTYLDASAVDSAFAVGRPLVEQFNYKVHASRRTEPGQAEVHRKDTDIIYVLEGSAVLVTGGEALDPRETAPEEIRGRSIAGGTERRIASGDLVIVPENTAHWFKEVSDPFLYYVVKVRKEER